MSMKLKELQYNLVVLQVDKNQEKRDGSLKVVKNAAKLRQETYKKCFKNRVR